MVRNLLTFIAVILAMPIQTAAPEPVSCFHQYLVFSGPIQECSRFEPSGVAWDKLSNTYIILNDKDDEPPVYVYRYNDETGRLELVKNLVIHKENGSPIQVKKFEDATASLTKEGIIYGITSCDRDDEAYNVLLKIDLSKTSKTVFEEVAYFKVALQKLREMLGVPYMKIEAMALSPDDEYLYIGIRELGAEYKHPQRVVMIWKLELKEISKVPEKVFQMETQDIIGRVEGMSSLEYDPVGRRYLMLTSFEGGGNSKDDVGSHLWALDREVLEQKRGQVSGKADLLHSFSHKAEGITVDGDGRIWVVFDDDSSRKEAEEKKAREQNRFHIGQNQAYYLFMR